MKCLAFSPKQSIVILLGIMDAFCRISQAILIFVASIYLHEQVIEKLR
jgi:hypothetical protein